jgi:hypothetical protein
VNFEYWQFAVLTGLNGIGSGLFSSPNRTAIMNSVPPNERGAASGMAASPSTPEARSPSASSSR